MVSMALFTYGPQYQYYNRTKQINAVLIETAALWHV